MLEQNGPVSNGYFGLGVVLTGLLYPAVGTESQTAQLLGSWWRQVSPAACLPQMPFVLVFVKLHLILPANHSNPFPNPPTTPLDRWGGTERPERAPSWDSRHLEHPGTLCWAKPWVIHVLIGWSASSMRYQTQMVSNQTWRYCSGFEKSFARSLPFLVLCLSVASCLREWAKIFTQRNSTQIFPDSNHYGHPKNTQFLRSPSIHCSYHWGMGVGIINPENCMIYH